MCQYLMVWASLWTLSSMLRSLSSPSPVSPLVDLLPLSFGQGTLSQCQEGWQCWMTQWLHSTPTPWLWLGDLEDSTNVQYPTTNPLRLWQAWQSGVSISTHTSRHHIHSWSEPNLVVRMEPPSLSLYIYTSKFKKLSIVEYCRILHFC